MKRSDALTRLSHDHQHGLAVAQRLRRATDETADFERDRFLAFWNDEGREHFRTEEDLLLPTFARHRDPSDEAVVRVLVEHVELRRRALDLEGGSAPTADELHDLGTGLHDHIRHEERVLYPLIEAALPDDELLALAAAIELAHDPGPR